MVEEEEIALSIDLKPKLHIEKARDLRPSLWLSVSKWLFGIILSVMVLASVIASKLSLIAIGTFYNHTRSHCDIGPDVQYSKETTFIMMVLILMIPSLVSFLRACWKSCFCKTHPWPTNAAIVWALIAATLEVSGLSFFVIVVVLKTTLSAAHCVVIMNCVFLFPITWEIIKLIIKNGWSFWTDKRTSGLLVASLFLEIIGVVMLSVDVISDNKPTINLQESIGIPICLLFVSVAWSNKMQRLQFEARKKTPLIPESGEKTGDNNKVEESTKENDKAAEKNKNLYHKKDTARYKATLISDLFKLIVTPLICALICYFFKTANLANLKGGFQELNIHNPAFPHFMAQIFTSFTGTILGYLACAIGMQKLAFFVPMFFATPFSIALVSTPAWCCTNAIPIKCIDVHDWILLLLAVCLWLAQVLSTGIYLVESSGQTLIMAKHSTLFWLPVYNGAFVEQSLLLNRKNKLTDESHMNLRETAKNSRVFICTTMYHENRTEMEQLLKSIRDIDKEYHQRSFESHIYFDDAITGDVLNDFVLQLIALVPKIFETVEIKNCTKIKTPYGQQLRWTLKHGLPFHIHLKDNSKVKAKKRWSQAMYMKYVINHRCKSSNEQTSENDPQQNLENTYILATDGDVRFTHLSVQALMDMMIRDKHVGAVCGRTYPLGSGPVVWYQVFDYAISHWFQKTANHVLGSVLCSPGCFSLYRVKALEHVFKTYTSRVGNCKDFLKMDMGEDRWLCTLMIQNGWRLEYCAAAKDSTYCPQSFNEFFDQRRRWIPSTLINHVQLIQKWKKAVKNNNVISVSFILYQALLIASTLISPATVILVITGALKFSKLPGSENDVAILITLCAVAFGFGLVCLYTKQSFQLKVAKVLTIVFALLMEAAAVGTAAQISNDLSRRSECGALANSATISSQPKSTSVPPTTLPIEYRDGLPADLSSLYLAGLVVIYFAAALLHPTEAWCLVHGIWYLCCLPSGYLLLIIYSLANITDDSWGTRELTKMNKVMDTAPWYKVVWDKLRTVFVCCRGEEKPIPSETGETNAYLECEDIAMSESGSSSKEESKAATSSDNQTKSSTKSDEQRAGNSDREREQRPDDSAAQPIEDWLPEALKKLHLKKFKDNGYDNTSFLIGMTEEDLRNIGIQDKGHRTSILLRINESVPKDYANTGVPDNVKDWLEKLGLKNYWPNFEKSEYRGPPMLANLKSMNSAKLEYLLKNELKIQKIGHLNKIVNTIRNLQYLTSAQIEIRNAEKELKDVLFYPIRDEADNRTSAEGSHEDTNPNAISEISFELDPQKEYDFWKKNFRLDSVLLPEISVFGTVIELKEKLRDLRDYFLTVFAVANAMWIIIIVTLDKQAELKIKGTNAIGLAFLCIYGLVIVIQFLTMIWHRFSTLCHFLAQAPWKKGGHFQLSWAFNEKDIPINKDKKGNKPEDRKDSNKENPNSSPTNRPSRSGVDSTDTSSQIKSVRS